ncbi:trypsin beta-like [Teleopsis dalmanni]|uniref:trypsin beta-like n=1 Tax=Teleopsis dalmanni TaxID=139649 RepID=UPI0018CD9053|nr:trypsin beta-like [Teleopsis dalmanni]
MAANIAISANAAVISKDAIVTPTTIALHPYQVSVRVDGIPSCIGTIISERVVITTALCIYLFSPPTYSIQYGVNTIGGSENIITAELLVKHQHFNPVNFDNNIGAIILSESIPLSENTKSIALAKSTPAAGTVGMLTGWGLIANTAILDEINLEIISNTECAVKYTGLNDISSSVLCAGVYEDLSQACDGVAGAPFVVNNTLVGVLSFGDGCGSTTDPAVFTSIPSALEWLSNEVNDVNVISNIV